MGLKCWQLYSTVMINMFCMDLRPHLRAFMCSRLSARIYGVLLWVCVCVDSRCQFLCSTHLAHCCCRRSVKRVPRWRAPVCRLSVWRWRHRGLSRKLGSEVLRREKASVGSIHSSVHPSTFPTQPQTRSGREQEGEGGGKVGMEEKEKDHMSMLEK